MPIERFGSFGEEVPLPSDAPTVSTDAELRSLLIDHRSRGVDVPVVGLLGGDLCRTLGGTGSVERLHGPDARTFAVDIGRLELDDTTTWFVAHVVVGTPFAAGTVVMQAEWLGDLDLGPRSHPADGRFDVTTGRLALRDRWRALRRARTGSHLPHPALEHVQRDSLSIDHERPMSVVVDGVSLGRFRHVRAEIEHQALRVVV